MRKSILYPLNHQSPVPFPCVHGVEQPNLFGDCLLFAFCERVPRFRTIGRITEDLFGDVELILCSSGPVFHPSPALHGKVDIAGNRWHRLSLDGYHWTGTSKLWARWLVFVPWRKSPLWYLLRLLVTTRKLWKGFCASPMRWMKSSKILISKAAPGATCGGDKNQQ